MLVFEYAAGRHEPEHCASDLPQHFASVAMAHSICRHVPVSDFILALAVHRPLSVLRAQQLPLSSTAMVVAVHGRFCWAVKDISSHVSCAG
jgi:hypothetical protein